MNYRYNMICLIDPPHRPAKLCPPSLASKPHEAFRSEEIPSEDCFGSFRPKQQICQIGDPYLEDHPRTCKWLVTPHLQAI